MTAPAYPKRPPFFAYRFCRLMAKACLANRIGPEGCWLLTIIAQTEDAAGYRQPVTFWNGQLTPLVGVGSESAFRRLREKCVNAGWLHYRAGRKGVAPAYWVVVPPESGGLPDGPSDERPEKYFASMPATGEQETGEQPAGMRRESEQETGEQPAGMRRESEQHSSHARALALVQEEDCSEPAGPASEPPVMVFPCVGTGPKEWPLAAAKLAEYEGSFPGLDVLAECRKARQWCLDNPKKRKTHAGMPKFLGGWLGKANDRPRDAPPAGHHERPPDRGLPRGGGGPGHRVESPPGKYARPDGTGPAGDGLQARRPAAPDLFGPAGPPAEPGPDPPRPAGGDR